MRLLLLALLLWSSFPSGAADHYSASITLPRGYVSGVLVLQGEDGAISGCLFNEFGITAIDFTYDRRKDKVKLHLVVKMMDKWYIRRVLRRDLREVLKRIERGDSTYEDSRYHIRYKFTPLMPEQLP